MRSHAPCLIPSTFWLANNWRRAAVNPPRERLALALDAQLLEQCCAFEDGIAALILAMPPDVVEAFAEQAIEEILVDFAQRTSGPGAARVYMALGAHLRDGVERRLEELRRSPDL